MIGDLRTDALHQALQDAPIDDQTLLALLVLAFGGDNVSVMSGAGQTLFDRRRVCQTITEGGVLTTDADRLRGAARNMLVGALSCRANATDSGAVARIVGDTIGATLRLPNMATEAFLSCLSKAAIEKVAAAEGVRVEVRGKDTRARLIQRFKDGVYVYPEAVFALTDAEATASRTAEPEDDADDADPFASGDADDETDGAVVDELPDDGGHADGTHDDDAEVDAPRPRSGRRTRSVPANLANAAE
jgi:ParB family chromosome partitioning protein